MITRVSIILLFTFTSINSLLIAQSTNSFMVGGEIGGNYSSQNAGTINTDIGAKVQLEEDVDYRVGAVAKTSFSLNITPNILFFISEELLIGGGIEWLTSFKDFEPTEFDILDLHTEKENSFIVYPEIRYYISNGLFIAGRLDIGKKLYKQNEAIYGYIQNNQYQNNNWPRGSEGIVYGGGISLGYSITLGKNAIADISTRYIIHKNNLEINTYRISGIDNSYVENKLHFSVALRYIKVKK